MKLGSKKNWISNLAWYVLIGYYCLYEFTTPHTHINGVIVNVIVLLLLVFVAGLLFLKNFLGESAINARGLFWVPFIMVLFYQIMNYACAKSYFMLYVLFALLIFFPIDKEELWNLTLNTMKTMAVICAIGVFVHLFLPAIHEFIVSIYLNQEALKYIDSYVEKGYYSGFLHQVGDAAFYITIGIIVTIFSDGKKLSKIALIVFLTLALLLLGKRSVFVFLLIALLVTFVLLGKKGAKVIRLLSALVIGFIVLVIIRQLSMSLSDVKLFAKLADTFKFIEAGDISGLLESSGRESLYDLAMKLYQENSWFGIGWNEFVRIVSDRQGVITSVHNIYLQLLCETGIVGLTAFLIGAITSLIMSLTNQGLIYKYKGNDKEKYSRMYAITVTGQIFFILFCFVENPIYNENCLIFYFFAVLLSMSLKNKLRQELKTQARNTK